LLSTNTKYPGPVGILDIDYHHGNGTQEIFYDSDAVMFVSIHANPEFEYPYYSGAREEQGSGNCDIFKFSKFQEKDLDGI
jgi:acetoin utilization deacetylase AcuC-like enzyme